MRGLLAIVWAVLTAGLVWFAVSSKAPAIEQDILVRATEAVKPLNANATVSVNGRFVTVRGLEPTEAEKAKTLDAADNVWGALGPFDGLWVPVAATPAPVTAQLGYLHVSKASSGALVATGEMPSEAARAELLSALRASGGQVTDNLTVRSSGLPGDWSGLALVGARALSSLDWGDFLIAGEKARLTGMTPQNRGVVDALGSRWNVALLPRTEDGSARIRQLEADVARLTAEAATCRTRVGQLDTNLKACVARANTMTTTACNAAVMLILEGRTITFATASAEITRDGQALLDQIAREAGPCVKDQGLGIAIGGHTDSQGDDDANLALSQRRAEAVREALVARGVPAEFITATGFGETQPIADNATDEGRAKNRRITFDWAVR